VQAQDLRDRSTEFEALQTRIVGCSFNTVAENELFSEAYDLHYDLLCDTRREVGLAYEACSSPRSPAALPISYLIDIDGTIVRRYRNIDPHDYAARVAQDLLVLAPQPAMDMLSMLSL
jgi:peroxiredoxin